MNVETKNETHKHQDIWLITGMSGSGKSVAVKALEDLGFYCIENLPIPMIPDFLSQISSSIRKIAIVVDVRQPILQHLSENELIQMLTTYFETTPKILFLDSDNETLTRRFSESRRPHPLSSGGSSILDGIQKERVLLNPLRESAKEIINTSTLNPQDLKQILHVRFGKNNTLQQLQITLMSFGFKHGVPLNADNMFDVRFLPNPYWEHDLREFSGEDQPVKQYLEKTPALEPLLRKMEDLLLFFVQQFEQTDRHYYTIAIGCTGGQHRSVYMAKQLAIHLEKSGYEIQLIHRDKKETPSYLLENPKR